MPHLTQKQIRPFIITFFILSICIVLWILPTLGVSAEDTGWQEEPALHYTALGDSIPNGYCAESTSELISYPSLIAEDLQTLNQTRTELAQYTKNGLTTAKLNETFLTQPEVQEALADADIITLTIGANDLMNEFKKVSREILDSQTKYRTADEALLALQEGISSNPLLLVDVVSAITGWDYDSFEEQWILAVETIHHFRKSDSQMVVTTIYNPVENAELPDTLNVVVKNLIAKMNGIIYGHSEDYNYQVVDLLNSDIAGHTQADGLHPDQQGQELIRNLIEAELNLQIVHIKEAVDDSQTKEAELAKERIAAEKKAARLREERLRQKRLFRICMLAGSLLLIILIITGIRRKKSEGNTNISDLL